MFIASSLALLEKSAGISKDETLFFSPFKSVRTCETVGTILCLSLLRKEVIQPHLPIRLPCYDLALLTNHTLDAFPPCGLEETVSGAVNSGGLTGGVYKTRERIHRAVSDARLLAIPAS